MSIHVVCPGCKKSWTVSDKYAGQQGPCPNCKTVLNIPEKGDEVVIHAPEGAEAKDSKGRAVLAPILREETKFSTKLAVGIGVAVVVVLAVAIYFNLSGSQPPVAVVALGAITLAPPLVLGGYAFLRNSELEPYRGKELALRVTICAAAYAFLWGVYVWLNMQLGPFEDTMHFVYVAPPIILAGGFAAFASLELEFLSGVIHYGLYLIVTVLLRVVAGMPAVKVTLGTALGQE